MIFFALLLCCAYFAVAGFWIGRIVGRSRGKMDTGATWNDASAEAYILGVIGEMEQRGDRVESWEWSADHAARRVVAQVNGHTVLDAPYSRG